MRGSVFGSLTATAGAPRADTALQQGRTVPWVRDFEMWVVKRIRVWPGIWCK